MAVGARPGQGQLAAGGAHGRGVVAGLVEAPRAAPPAAVAVTRLRWRSVPVQASTVSTPRTASAGPWGLVSSRISWPCSPSWARARFHRLRRRSVPVQPREVLADHGEGRRQGHDPGGRGRGRAGAGGLGLLPQLRAGQVRLPPNSSPSRDDRVLSRVGAGPGQVQDPALGGQGRRGRRRLREPHVVVEGRHDRLEHRAWSADTSGSYDPTLRSPTGRPNDDGGHREVRSQLRHARQGRRRPRVGRRVQGAHGHASA